MYTSKTAPAPALPHYLFEEDLSLLQNVLQLNEVEEVPLQRLLVSIDLLHLCLQHLELGLGGGEEQREGGEEEGGRSRGEWMVYLHMYHSTCMLYIQCKCTSIHVHVHVYVYKYMYMYMYIYMYMYNLYMDRMTCV